MALLPYALLALGTALAMATRPLLDNTPGETAAMLGCAVFSAAWIWWWTTAHPHWASDTSRMSVYYFVRSGAAFVLTWINPFYGVFAFLGYVDVSRYFQMPFAIVAFAINAVTVAGSQAGGMPPEGVLGWSVFGGMYLMNLGVGSCFAFLGTREDAVNRARVEMINELETANARLETALAENATLQRQLVSQAREAGIDDERQRLAREIHDTIAQGLAGIVTQLQAASEGADRRAAVAHVERAATLARTSLDNARRSVRDLSPTELDHADLPKALHRLVTSWAEDGDVDAELTVTGNEVRLHDEIESTLLRIVQEGLANVHKHADARRVGVTLSYMGDEVTVDVRDDGRGFCLGVHTGTATGTATGTDTGTTTDTGYGLRVMRQRAERIAGTFGVESEPGAGTAISVRVPGVMHDE